MIISKAEAAWLILLFSIATAVFLEGCADTVPVITPSAGCIQSCRYEIKCGDGEVCDYGYRQGSCNSPAECDQIKNSTAQITVGKDVYNLYRFDAWDVNKQTCTYGDGDKYFPSQQEATCGQYDNRFCSYVQSKAPTCLCDIDNDHDCDGVPDTQDKCQDVNDPLRFEDIDGFEDQDGCADIDNDKDGICDAWVTENHLESKYFKSKGCVGGIGNCCEKNGVDICPNQPCDITGNPDRCSKTDDPHYGCRSDVTLLPANQFSATVSPSYASEGTEFEPVARFLSFGPAETHFPGYNVITFKIAYGKDVGFADKLKVKWTVTLKSVGDQAPRVDPLIGETGWDAVNQKPEDLKITFLEQKASERGHAIAVEVSAEIENLSEFVDGVSDIKALRIEQTGADVCVQKGLDGGTATDYNACHYESLKFTSLTFKSDHETQDGDNVLHKSGTYLWVVGPPMNTKADPYEYFFDGSRNHPITHSTSVKMKVALGVDGISQGDMYTLEGAGAHPYTSFSPSTTPLAWSGQALVTADMPMPLALGVLDEPITWTLKVYDKSKNVVATITKTSGPHHIYLTYDTPISGTSLSKSSSWPVPFRVPEGRVSKAENEITSQKLDILLRPYSEIDPTKDKEDPSQWGIMGGLSDVGEIADAAHRFLNHAPIIVDDHKTQSCFNSAGSTEYMWSIFTYAYGGSRCVERALLMEIFLKSVGIAATAYQVKASNDANVPLQNMINEPRVVYKSRPSPTPNEWLLMNFAPPPPPTTPPDPPSKEIFDINEGEGVTMVDLSQGVGTPNVKYFPHALNSSTDDKRRSTIGKTPCDILKRIDQEFGFKFQQWCGKLIPDEDWNCSDREPVPNCPE